MKKLLLMLWGAALAMPAAGENHAPIMTISQAIDLQHTGH